ncbi:type VI secretion system TssO [Niabella ginsengisoli]|uniref:Type VI secretion system transmembrane protein TssO n=1 Tax=Niabella ginsengisoli TaxID=522298 RepID=A0ABS9SLG9_9BACT|nr:type VI secretion system TssO [Niabella ginsengisoli]MCH5599214.1 type VI secretion system transmembrane protein TssO [Niabella ginsengisoli]
MAQIVINAKERRQAFWKFLLFFLLSVGIILLAVYFDTLVPSKENKMMREQLAKFKIRETAQERFTNSMNEAKSLIDSLRKPGANQAYINSQILEKIRELTALQYKDSSMYSRLNSSVIDVFQRYQESVGQVAKLGTMPEEFQKLKQDYDNSQKELITCRQNLNNLLNPAGTY